MPSRVYRILLCLLVVPTYFSLSAALLWGQDKSKGQPPANVAVAVVKELYFIRKFLMLPPS
jgi:hypothetical protein